MPTSEVGYRATLHSSRVIFACQLRQHLRTNEQPGQVVILSGLHVHFKANRLLRYWQRELLLDIRRGLGESVRPEFQLIGAGVGYFPGCVTLVDCVSTMELMAVAPDDWLKRNREWRPAYELESTERLSEHLGDVDSGGNE